MELHAVESSRIKKMGYDPATEELVVQFKKGGVYKYSGVSKAVYAVLISAPSLGSTFQTMIVNNKNITYERIDT
jgi:hypothetical protein